MSPGGATGSYPPNWQAIATHVKEEAGWECVRCGHEHDTEAGYMLTVHHLDLDKSNCRWWNLAALCQRCHLSIQARVQLERPWILEHTAWFKIYAAGWYAFTYLGENPTRAEAEERLEELLALERVA